jgi:hypothetical protein
MHRRRRMPWTVLAALAVLAGCASWLPRAETPSYAGVEGLRVHAQAAASSPVIGRLRLHERVLRAQVDRGFAHVRSERSGVVGWVDETKLLARIPAARAPAPHAPATPAAAPAATEPAATDVTPPEPTPSEPAAEPPAAEPASAESTPATPPPPPDPPRREPAVFDPF